MGERVGVRYYRSASFACRRLRGVRLQWQGRLFSCAPPAQLSWLWRMRVIGGPKGRRRTTIMTDLLRLRGTVAFQGCVCMYVQYTQ